MGKAVDDALLEQEKDIYWLNSNAKHLPDDGLKILPENVAVTYTDNEERREQLEQMDSGDIIILYVSKSYVDFVGGHIALGRVYSPVVQTHRNNTIYGGPHDVEHHLRTNWTHVTPYNRTVTPAEARPLVGDQPVGTVTKARKTKDDARLVADLIRARATHPPI